MSKKASTDDPVSASMVGYVHVLGFSELVQMLTDTKKTGCLVIELEAGVATVFVDQGALKHAELGDWDGGAAVSKIMASAAESPDAQFRFLPMDESDIAAIQESLKGDPQQILFAASVAFDHARRDGDPH